MRGHRYQLRSSAYRRSALALAMLLAVLSASLTPAPAQAVSSELRRYPYLTDVVGSFATINWATTPASDGAFVRWGRVGQESCTAHVTQASSTAMIVNQVKEYQWKATLSLAPGAEYCYRVYLGSSAQPINLLGADPTPQFWTQVPAGSQEPFSFAVFGDWGAVDENGANTHQANLMKQIARSGARFALTTGDNAYPAGSQTNYGDLVQTGGNISGVFGPTFWTVAGSSIPLFPAIGNHGLSNAAVPNPHLLNFPQDHAVASSGGRYKEENYCCLNGTLPMDYVSTWYAFDAGIARIYVLHAAWSEANNGDTDDYENDYDYHWAPNSAQYRWLANDLAEHPSALKFAIFHYPLYSDNFWESSDTYLRGPTSLEGLLSRNGVAIAFNGHAHFYQRNRKPNANSLISYITGGGGAKPEPLDAGCSAVDAYAIGWSFSANAGSSCGAPKPTSITQVYHFLLVTVNGARVTVTPTDSLGRTFDVQTYTFTPTPDAAPPSAPARLRATPTSATQIDLTWTAATDNVGVQGYTITRDGAPLATLDATTLAYADANLTPKTTYRYSVSAFDALGNRSPATSATATTLEATALRRMFLPIAANSSLR